MNNAELLEIRKQLQEKKCALDHIAGAFINNDNEKKGIFAKLFLDLPREEALKYFDMFKSVLSVTHGADIEISGDIRRLLETYNKNTDSGVEDLIIDRLASETIFTEGAGKTVFLVHGSYDVPIKTKDKMQIAGESDEVYTYTIGIVCPVKQDKGTLGYLSEEDVIRENDVRNVISKPEYGFIYPAFNDRSADVDNAFIFSKDDLEGFADRFFGQTEIQESEKPNRKKKEPRASVTEETSVEVSEGIQTIRDDTPIEDEISEVSHVAETRTETSAWHSEQKDRPRANSSIPSLDSGILSNDCSYIKGRIIDPDEEEEKEERIRMPDLPHEKTRKKKVRISGDTSLVTKKEIDGKTYYMVLVNDTDLAV